MHKGIMSYSEWVEQGLNIIERDEVIAFGLHDCYAEHWLPHYDRLLAKLGDLGECCTLDALANQVLLSNCV